MRCAGAHERERSEASKSFSLDNREVLGYTCKKIYNKELHSIKGNKEDISNKLKYKHLIQKPTPPSYSKEKQDAPPKPRVLQNHIINIKKVFCTT